MAQEPSSRLIHCLSVILFSLRETEFRERGIPPNMMTKIDKTQRPEQTDIVILPIRQILRVKAFRLGFSEQRAGRKFQYDEQRSSEENWHYERGRQLALAAP